MTSLRANRASLTLGSALLVAGALFGLQGATAAERIGLALPMTGRFAAIAERMEFGALKAAASLKQQGRDIEIILADVDCGDDESQSKTEALRKSDLDIVVGPVCFDAAKGIAQQLKSGIDGAVPVIAAGTRNVALQRSREVDKLPLFEIANPPDAEARAVVDLILPMFEGKPFAILDDGSVYGRSLADQVRQFGEQEGLRPVTLANFRPLLTTQLALLRRLQRSGVEAVFIAAAAEDIITISRDLTTLGLQWPVGTGEQGRVLDYSPGRNELRNGLLMVRATDLRAKAAEDVLAQLKDGSLEVEDSLLLGHALIEIAAQADNLGNLAGQTFQTIIGPVTFGEDGRATPAPFVLYRWNNGEFVVAAPR